MRVSTMPTIHGEKVVIRILDRERVILPLDKLGFSENNYRTFLNFLLSHTGMILVTGPTAVSYTHLDVYKRQGWHKAFFDQAGILPPAPNVRNSRNIDRHLRKGGCGWMFVVAWHLSF